MTKQNIIGESLRNVRRSQKLTQEQLAARCGVLGWDMTENTITKIETGLRCVTDRELLVLAQALKVKLKELLPGYGRLF